MFFINNCARFDVSSVGFEFVREAKISFSSLSLIWRWGKMICFVTGLRENRKDTFLGEYTCRAENLFINESDEELKVKYFNL